MSFVEIQNLSYRYDNSDKVLNNVNLSINKGEIVLVLGKTGSGKSSLLKTIVGSIPNFYGGEIEGKVIIDNKDLNEMDHKERSSKVSIVFQSPETQLIMDKVHREVAFPLENLGVEEASIKRRVFEALKFMNLLPIAYKNVEELSGGEKQKVVISSALAMKTDILLLDEPTSQLDPQSSEELVYFIKKINEELNKTIVVVEQNNQGWFEMADKIIVMNKGKIDFCGTKEQLYAGNWEEFLPQYLRIAKRINYPQLGTRRQVSKWITSKITNSEKNQHVSEEKREKILTINKLNVRYDEKLVLKDISLDFEEGKIYSILGENGAGKSTLLKSIMNLIDYKGEIKYKNKKLSKLKVSEIAKSIGYVSQNPDDYISRSTVYEEVKFTLDNFNMIDEGKVDSILKKLDLLSLKDKNPRDLSGGEKERLAIASILVMDTDIVLLDEPTRGLDLNNKHKLINIFKELAKLNKTVIMITHDMDFASEISDEIILLMQGEVIDNGKYNNVLKEGIYYTSTVHKLTSNNNIFRVEELTQWIN